MQSECSSWHTKCPKILRGQSCPLQKPESERLACFAVEGGMVVLDRDALEVLYLKETHRNGEHRRESRNTADFMLLHMCIAFNVELPRG